MSKPTFGQLLKQYRTQQFKGNRFVGKLLALDPGETTGWSLFEAHADCDDVVTMTMHGQITCTPLNTGIDRIEHLLKTTQPNFLVYEQYRVYSWKSATHSWSELHTPKLIGAIVTVARNIPQADQMAQVAKSFVTDDKLREWGYWLPGMRHARDSIRHALYWLMFHKPDKPQ